MKLSEMTTTERSLLLYLETRVVDYGGRVNQKHMNSDDRTILDRWVESKFVSFGRIIVADHNRDGTHWVRLSGDAWDLAHMERLARGARMWSNRAYTTTAEKRGEEVPEPKDHE
jgi:hypothetical protein